jgi:hypothetical protein
VREGKDENEECSTTTTMRGEHERNEKRTFEMSNASEEKSNSCEGVIVR